MKILLIQLLGSTVWECTTCKKLHHVDDLKIKKNKHGLWFGCQCGNTGTRIFKERLRRKRVDTVTKV